MFLYLFPQFKYMIFHTFTCKHYLHEYRAFIPLLSSECNEGFPSLAKGHITASLSSECPRPNACPISWVPTWIIDKESVVIQSHHPEVLPEKDHFSSWSKWIRPLDGRYACATTPPFPSNSLESTPSPGMPSWILPPKLTKQKWYCKPI